MLTNEDYIFFGKEWARTLTDMLWNFFHDEGASHDIQSTLFLDWKVHLSIVGQKEDWVLQCCAIDYPVPKPRQFETWQVPHFLLVTQGIECLLFTWVERFSQDKGHLFSPINLILTEIARDIDSGGAFITRKNGVFVDEKIYEGSPQFRTS